MSTEFVSISSREHHNIQKTGGKEEHAVTSEEYSTKGDMPKLWQNQRDVLDISDAKVKIHVLYACQVWFVNQLKIPLIERKRWMAAIDISRIWYRAHMS